MRKGDKMIYGNNDGKHAIECVYTGERITSNGEIIIIADCGNNATIMAPIAMFQKIGGRKA